MALSLTLAATCGGLIASNWSFILFERLKTTFTKIGFLYLPYVVAIGISLAIASTLIVVKVVLPLTDFEVEAVARSDQEWNLIFALDEALSVIRWWIALFFFYRMFTASRSNARAKTRISLLVLVSLSAVGFFLASVLHKS